MIFNIRGTSGSGKSHIAHSLLKYNHEEVLGKDGKIIAYWIKELNTYLLGKYSNVCGGCDGIKSADLVCERVEKFMEPNLVFEGLLVSHSFERYHLLAEKLGGMVLCFLDTTPEKCIERVYARREERGKVGEFNEEQIYKDHRAVQRCCERFAEAGHIVYELESENSVNDFMEVFMKHRRV